MARLIPSLVHSWKDFVSQARIRYIYGMKQSGFINYLIHIGLWCFMVLFVFDYHWFDISWYEALGYSLMEVLGYMLIFYVNFWFLQRQSSINWLSSIIYSGIVTIVYIAIIRYSGLEDSFYEAAGNRNLFSLFLNASLFTGLAYLFSNLDRYIKTQDRNLQLQANNKQLQIDSLKARINPHFLFNTLNNMNALILKKEDKVPIYLSKLSRVLRYSMDSGQQQMVSLEKEISYVEDYLDLVKMQEPASTNIDVYIEGKMNGVSILPFILMTLLENAIKHGDIMYNPAAFLHLTLTVEEHFAFEITNSKTIDSTATNKNGTGLANIQKQLDLVYGTNADLQLRETEGTYRVRLIIPLNRPVYSVS